MTGRLRALPAALCLLSAPVIAAAWVSASDGPENYVRAAAIGAALAAGAAASVAGAVWKSPARTWVTALVACATSAVVFDRLRGWSENETAIPATISVLSWFAALAAIGAIGHARRSAAAGVLLGAGTAVLSLSTPWWWPAGPSYVPESVVQSNPWLTAIATGLGTDWIRAPGLYRILGSAYTPPPSPSEAIRFWLIFAGGAALFAVAVRRAFVRRSLDRAS